MKVTAMEYSGDATFEVNGHSYTATVEAEASYSFTPGRRYMSNGDPGYPDEEEFEVTDVQVSRVVDEVTEEVVPYDAETMEDALCDALSEKEFDEVEVEPDTDYYEMRELARYEAECSVRGY